MLYAAAALVLVIAIVATQSRGGTLGLAAVGIYYWSKNDRKLLTGAIAVVVLAIALLNAPAAYFQRMETMTDVEDGSAQGRIQAWQTAIAVAIDHPLMGAGAGHFPVENGIRNNMSAKTAHSIYFLILGDLGLPGLIVLVWFLVANFAQNRRLAATLKADAQQGANVRLLMSLSAALIGYATAGAFLSATYVPHMFVLAGLLTATRSIIVNEQRQPSRAAVQPSHQPVSLHWALQPKPSLRRSI
jgi:probable O-glycosylation ligase (exosortase A-associated)